MILIIRKFLYSVILWSFAAIVATADEKEAFANIDVAILVGAMPRRDGMERKDLLKANAKIFKTQGEALEKYAKKTCKIVVVGNPANTNCLIASKCAPSIPKENFTCLTRLDHNRAIAQVHQSWLLESSCQSFFHPTVVGIFQFPESPFAGQGGSS